MNGSGAVLRPALSGQSKVCLVLPGDGRAKDGADTAFGVSVALMCGYAQRAAQDPRCGATIDDGGVLAALTRIPLDGGGCILVEQQAEWDGPVKASRIGDAVRELPVTLERALEPVTEAARASLDQLRKAHADQITVEFGIDLAFEAGAVITKSQASCHLKVTISWKSDRTAHPHAGTSTGSR